VSIKRQISAANIGVAADASGNLMSAMYGAYGTTLKLVAVDSDGRMTSVVMDDVDQWGNILQGGFAELAARLGAIQSYERRGQVVFQDDFRHGVSAWSISASSGAYARPDPTVRFQSPYSVRMYPGAVDNYSVQLAKPLGTFPVGTGFGFAVWIRPYPAVKRFMLRIQAGNGSLFSDAIVRATYADGKLWYYNSGGTYTEFGTWPVGVLEILPFRFAKLVIDGSTGKYKRFIIDDQEIDMSGIACYTTAVSTKYLTPSVQVVADGTNNGPAYLGNAVLTTMEP